jgi:amino acid transporter
MWLLGGLGFCGSLLAFVLSFIPPSQIAVGSNTVWYAVLIIGAIIFVVMPSVQSFYQILSQLTVLLYLIMYMLMFSAAIVLRYKLPKMERPFRLGAKGNGLMWLLGGLGFCGSLLAFVLSFIPPSQIATGSTAVWFGVLIIGAVIFVGIPFIIYGMRKPTWKAPDAEIEKFEWEK